MLGPVICILLYLLVLSCLQEVPWCYDIFIFLLNCLFIVFVAYYAGCKTMLCDLHHILSLGLNMPLRGVRVSYDIPIFFYFVCVLVCLFVYFLLSVRLCPVICILFCPSV